MAWTGLEQLAPVPIHTIAINGIDLTPYVLTWRFRWPWHGKATWDLSAWHTPTAQPWVNGQSDFRLPGFNDFAGLLRRHNRSTGRLLSYSVSVAGMSKTWDRLLPRGPAFDGDVLTWPGEDYTAALEKEGQTFTDILLDQGSNVSAHTAMAEMAAAAGVKIVCLFPDFTIRVLRRARGRILDFCDQIGRVYQCGRRWLGNTLVYQAAKPDAGASWSFRDNLTIETFLVEEIWDDQSNRFKVTRFEPVAGIIGEQFASGSGAVGRVGNISFSPASRTAYPEIRTNMDLIDWVFKDEAGEPIAGSVGGILASAFPAGSVEFTSKPIVPATTQPPATSGTQGDTSGRYTPFFEVVFTGSGRGSGAAHSSQYTITVNDSATQAIFGVEQDYQDLEDPIYPTAAVAQDAAEAVLAESVRHVYRAVMRTPYLNPMIEPGQVIRVTDYLTGQSGTNWFVEAVTHDLAAGGEWSMELELSKGL